MPSELQARAERQWLDLSLAQQAVWLDAKVSESSAYQLGGWAKVSAQLDESTVRQTISLIMARHDGLRLRVDDELPRQWMDQSVEPPLTVIDLPSDPENVDAAFKAYLRKRMSAPMPLGDCPLFAVDLIRTKEQTSYLLWRFHHLLADSASVVVTISHWLDAYEALSSGSPRELAPPSSYLKVISADSVYLNSAAYQKDLAYWTGRFSSLPPPLMSDLGPAGHSQEEPAIVEWRIGGDELGHWQEAAKNAGTNVQRALFALFAIVMGRRHGQTDIVSGIALHRRDVANWHTIGMIAGVLPMRCRFDSFWTLAECVQAFSEQFDADLRHQRLPVDVLSRALGLSGTGRAGLFEIAMSYIPGAGDSSDLVVHGVPVHSEQIVSKEASPLSLHIAELASGNGLAICIAANTGYVCAQEAQAAMHLLRAAVEQFVHEPDTRLEDLRTLTQNEHELVMETWNRTKARIETGTLDTLFQAQARRTPDAIAVIGRNGEQISYAQLDARSTKLARALASHGVKPERVVGVRMERSAETIIALLAILKSGGVYLPLDPAYPKERLDYIAYDAGALLVLDSVDSLCGDAELPKYTDADRLAYAIYTSGTTGVPKGVEVTHRAPVNLAFGRRAAHDPIGAGDRVLAGISVGFDVSIGQLLLPLLGGATVVIAPDLRSLDAVEFWKLLEERQVTHINSVPSFIDSVLDSAPSARQLSLKRLMLGGEALSGSLVGRIKRLLPSVEVVNMYGPTEVCIDATFYVAGKEDLHLPVLPIGKPLPNYRAYVLNPLLEPVGLGVAGELYLSGAGLARGYVNAAELTSERFVADPFAPESESGARLYRTGDRARWRADGQLEFLGRVDQQIKIRGFRVEPAEIAAALADHPSVNQAVVVARALKPEAPQRLIAYLVPRDGVEMPDSAELRTSLLKRLPDYMVPSAFVALTCLPLTRNGKLDEKALPTPEPEEGAYCAPRTPTEETIARLFAEVLGRERCGAMDHFFELGGHSLLAASLVSKLRVEGMQVPLRAVFETPTVEGLAQRIDQSGSSPPPEAGIVVGERPARIPVSFPQERIWFVDRLQQDASFNIPVALELSGALDMRALEQALERIVARHESLRTRIVLDGERACQEVMPPPALLVPKIDLTGETEERRDATLQKCLIELAAQRFDLANGYPFEMRLLTLEAQRHVLAMVIHHVAFDGWSAAIFLREFSALYNAFSKHQPDLLPPPKLQYPDFAIWQRDQDRSADLAFWTGHLRNAPPESQLPPDSGAKGEKPVQLIPFELPSELYQDLHAVSRDNGASLFMLLHAALALLVARLTGQDDVVIGTVAANRNRAELEDVIGCFVNTLALRTTFEPHETFIQLLRRVKDADLAAFAHQDLPFEQLVEALQPERSLARTPIFQILFVMQNAPAPVADFAGLQVSPIPTESQAPQFNLTVSLTQQNGAVAGSLEFATNRYSAETIERFGKQFRLLLENLARDCEQQTSEISLLNAEERSMLLEEWSGEAEDFPKEGLVELFRQQVRAQPSAVAVVTSNGRELSYLQLDAQSNALARYLVSKGIGPERVVGVRMERSAETIIAFLAILKAGGVYLPLDPAYPSDRLDYMVSDAGAGLVLDSIEGLDADCSVPPDNDINHLAYIIYTSGTTGKPKGVAVPHSALLNLLHARLAAHDPTGAGDRVLAGISVGFDVSIGQLLLPLLAGATVVIAPELKSLDGGEFWNLLTERQVTHVNSVPSFIESVLNAAALARQVTLKRLMLGGEALNGSLVSRIKRLLPGLEVVNMYGPTEACIDATFYITKDDDIGTAVLPIGRPLPNYKTYILDSRLEPVAIGIVGELYIAGSGLARGYLNAPELTGQKFIANPFSSDPAARMYRTGDLARWRSDGAIEFLGRTDYQVKIRGFRIELGEIESALRAQAGVREAAVVAQTISGSARLIAYFTALEEDVPEPDALRRGLAARLPDYMVPAAFTHLPQLPLLPSGKLDRRSLPAPDQSAFASRPFEPAIGGTEGQIAAIWAELLKLERVGRHDNFFELGGHSLLAVSLIQRMQQAGLFVDVRSLFASPTVAGLAGALAQDDTSEEAVPPNRIEPGCTHITPEMLTLVQLSQSQIDSVVSSIPGGSTNLQELYPLAPLQEGIYFQHLMTKQGDPYLTPVLLSFDTRARVDAFISALQAVVARHDVLRTGIVAKGLDEPLQFVLRRVTVLIEELTFDSDTEVDAELLRQFDPNTYRMDLGQAPLLRIALARDGKRNCWLLLLLMHHLILDHAGQEILVQELRSLMADPSMPLPAPISYRNFIAQTRRGPTREQHETFFRRMLSDVHEPTAPFGMVDVQVDTSSIEEHTLQLEGSLAQRVRANARKLGVSPASLLHLAWAAVLGHVSGNHDVVFGTILFGRMRAGAGADRAVGMFINTLPMRVQLGDAPLPDAVRETHLLLTELLAHEHAPLALAQRSSGIPAPAPLFSSLFNYRHSPEDMAQVDWSGVRLENASERTNYPLAMAVDDSGKGFALRALVHPKAGGDRVCRYFEQALKSLVDKLDHEPAASVRDLQVLPRAERHLVLEEWNRTEKKFAEDTLDALFEAQAQRTPDLVAVIDSDGSKFTYGELDRESSSLARKLTACGVGPERVVGVRMKRSRETVVAILGILKAGGAYLPLDPAYPAERLEYMANDARALLILESVHDLREEAPLLRYPCPNRTAYIIYTSGTSGRPKGVAVSHKAPVNLAFARRACHDPIGPGDRILAAVSVGFDVSIGQLLLPLLSGATVVVADDLKTTTADAFWSSIARHRVSHINSVPSFLDSVLPSVPAPATLALKRLMLGGEPLSGSLVARIQHALPAVDVVNMYGPTEACIDATYYSATESDYSAAVLPIGRPLSNYQAYVLSTSLEPVGIGVIGELYLGGDGLAVGYVKAPELTAERFIADPFSSVPGAKLYQTGDLAAWRADGVLEFRGRADKQIKIRGFRVEPAEIESHLLRQPTVREAAVISQNIAGGPRLIAYYCGDRTPEVLRQNLLAKLPDYMVPAAFVQLEKLPLTPNGKLDTRTLPDPSDTAFSSRPFEPPATDTERKIADLWKDLLHVERVGRQDNFFELGGHSLLAMTMAERMRQLGLAADVRALFTNPTVAGLSETAESASLQSSTPENRILPGTQRITPEMLSLVELTQAKIDKIAGSVPGGAANIQDIYPLAPLQGGILFEHLVKAEGDPYLAPFLLAFPQRERLDAFVAALGKVVERHDVLRTAMIWQGVEKPLQVVLRKVSIPTEEVSITAGHDAAEEMLKRFDPAHYRINLAQAPLIRVAVAHDAAQNRWLLLLLTHHMILDHTSVAIMVGELRALMENAQTALPAPIPYRNFVAQTLEDAKQNDHDAFFRAELAEVDEPTAPFGLLDNAASAADTSEYALRLDLNLCERIRERARSLGVTPASLFHAAWAAVLGLISGKSDVVFGTVLLGRMRSGSGADRAVGMFINTLPIRFTLDARAVREFVLETQRRLADLMAHEHAPLAVAQRASSVAPPMPLFSSLFNYRFSPEEEDETPWHGVELLHAAEHTNYPLAMAVDDSGSRFTLRALAQSSAGPERVCRYLLNAVTALEKALGDPTGLSIDSLAVIDPAERTTIVEDWNRTAHEFAIDTLDSAFREQARRTPDAIAVVAKDGAKISYSDLDSRSTQVAQGLVSNGVKPGDVVGVRMERSAETVIAFLAILKAGGVYLPLDPAYPANRLAFMAEDAGARLVLQSIAGLSGLGELPQLRDPKRLAYVIYTSGTTGKPKAVAVSHAAAVNLAFARKACHDPIGVDNRVLAAISVGFDVSIGQLLLPLLSGATVVIAGDLRTMGSREFWAFLSEREITHINSVPSFFDSVLAAAPVPSTLSLKRLMLGGEPLTGSLVERISRTLPGIEIVNMYGPTEACIDATYHVATPEDCDLAVLPIGRPLSNYRAYVLDRKMQPVGIGIPGELYLGGAGLAAGYLRAPDMTAERFVADPFSVEPDARLYRTGDLASWRADGELEFRGRVDKQVKIRGHRIELGEIEAALLQHSAIGQAAVIADGQRLLAYLVPAVGASVPDSAEIRQHLAAQLTDYMIPAAFAPLASLPLTPNGKLDVKALPKPAAESESATAFVAPRNAVEDRLQRLWQEELNVKPVGVHDNFFSLGGHSLAAMRLIYACNQEFGIDLPIRGLFLSPTIADVAAAIDAGPGAISAHLIPLQPKGQKTNLFTIHPAGGLAFCYLPLARSLGEDQPLYGMQASGLEAGEPLANSIEQMAEDYVAAIRKRQPEGPYQLLGMSSGGLIAFEMARQLRAASQEVSFLAMLDTSLPDPDADLEVSREDLLNATAVELGCPDLVEGVEGIPQLVEIAKQKGRLPVSFNPDQAERIAAVYGNSVRLVNLYRPQPWDAPLVFVRALRRDDLPDWSQIVPKLKLFDLDCHHYDLVAEPLAPTIANIIREYLK